MKAILDPYFCVVGINVNSFGIYTQKLIHTWSYDEAFKLYLESGTVDFTTFEGNRNYSIYIYNTRIRHLAFTQPIFSTLTSKLTKPCFIRLTDDNIKLNQLTKKDLCELGSSVFGEIYAVETYWRTHYRGTEYTTISYNPSRGLFVFNHLRSYENFLLRDIDNNGDITSYGLNHERITDPMTLKVYNLGETEILRVK